MKNYGTFKADKAATDDFVTARDKKNSEGYPDSLRSRTTMLVRIFSGFLSRDSKNQEKLVRKDGFVGARFVIFLGQKWSNRWPLLGRKSGLWPSCFWPA